jgi:hypothetical protein
MENYPALACHLQEIPRIGWRLQRFGAGGIKRASKDSVILHQVEDRFPDLEMFCHMYGSKSELFTRRETNQAETPILRK